MLVSWEVLYEILWEMFFMRYCGRWFFMMFLLWARGRWFFTGFLLSSDVLKTLSRFNNDQSGSFVYITTRMFISHQSIKAEVSRLIRSNFFWNALVVHACHRCSSQAMICAARIANLRSYGRNKLVQLIDAYALPTLHCKLVLMNPQEQSTGLHVQTCRIRRQKRQIDI